MVKQVLAPVVKVRKGRANVSVTVAELAKVAVPNKVECNVREAAQVENVAAPKPSAAGLLGEVALLVEVVPIPLRPQREC